MDACNRSAGTGFVLTGLSDMSAVRYPLFAVFAVIYQATLLGNGAILVAIGAEAKLHTPMYYFLANLSLLDMCCPTATVPKMLHGLWTQETDISLRGCAAQLYFLVALAGTEVFLLSVMAYDRYVAICAPLRYPLVVTGARCARLAAGAWAAGFLNSLVHTVATFRLSFCRCRRVRQFYCDIPPVVALACSSTYVAEMLVLVLGGVLGVGAFLATFVSYVCIISAVLRVPSAAGKRKAFSTCAAHLLVVGLFYGGTISTYVRPSSWPRDPARDRLISMLYGVVTPMLNPVIYSLRNAEVKGALRRALCGRASLQPS